MRGQQVAVGLTDLAAGTGACAAERWDEMLRRSGEAGHEGGCTLACR